MQEQEAWVAHAIAVATAPIVVLQRKSLAEEYNITCEISSKIMSIIIRFVSLFQDKIIRIFTTNSSQSTSTSYAIYGNFSLSPCRTIFVLVLRTECLDSAKHQGLTKILKSPFTKYERMFSIITQLFLFFALEKRPQISTSPSSNFTAMSTNY